MYQPHEYAYDTDDLLAINDVLQTLDNIIAAFCCQPRFRRTEAQKWIDEVQCGLTTQILAITQQLAHAGPTPDVVGALTSLYGPWMEIADSLRLRDALGPVLNREIEWQQPAG